jgi:hypothetical protein
MQIKTVSIPIQIRTGHLKIVTARQVEINKSISEIPTGITHFQGHSKTVDEENIGVQ